MGKIIILPETTKNPISLIGERAGVCWGADITNAERNYKRGLDCIKSGHGRTLEFVNVEMILDGYSARVIREWYTHLGGAPTRLQASTRYIDYGNFDYIVPPTIECNPEAKGQYERLMNVMKYTYGKLQEAGIPKEDIANILPLGMETRVVDKRNLRNLADMSRQRYCTRAYWEFQKLMRDITSELREISEEWKTVTDLLFMPKCMDVGYCTEHESCGRMPKR